MNQIEVTSAADLSAKVGQLRTLAITGFNAGLSKCYLAISREPFENRSSAQNKLLWPLLRDFSKYVEHYGNNYAPEQWKDILTSGFEGVTTFAPNLEGTGLIALGARTSKYSKKKFSEFIEFIYAEGVTRGVTFSEKSEQSMNEVRS